MQLTCIHCGKPFTITHQQLGGRGKCPHCMAEIRLPEAADGAAEKEATPPPPGFRWWENSVSGLASLIFHMVVMLILAMITYGGAGGEGRGEDVLIGDLPALVLSDAQSDELTTVPALPSQAGDESAEVMEVEPPTETASETSSEEPLAVVSPSASISGGSNESFDLGGVSAGGGGMSGSGNWGGLVKNLQRHGLDIVICFDSTGSMGGEIREVKEQIRRIGDTLVRLIPKARISICTYRDRNDDYVVQGLPLTNDMQAVASFLSGIEASGGGYRPESVHAGLRWSVDNNKFTPSARKVILLFGDAPPHAENLSDCLTIASDFARQQKGIVSTVTCRSPIRLPEFVEIAQMGGGEAFLTVEERQIITELMILVFGSQYRDKVVEAFRLLDR